MTLIIAPPILITRRLTLRLARREDVAGILEFYRLNEEHLRPFEPVRPAGFSTAAWWRARVARDASDFRAGSAVRTFVFPRKGGAPIGSANLNNIIRGVFHSCFLGFNVGRDQQGRGVMKEALTALLAYAFDELQIHRISANYMPHNRRSGNLLRGLGFVAEGYARDYLLIAGRWEDHVLTSLLNPGWKEP